MKIGVYLVHSSRTTGDAGPRWTVFATGRGAHRSLASWPLQAMAAHREGGNVKREMRRDRGTAQQSLDDGEEAAHRRWNFGSKR
jgi:hypothetical protein